MTLLKTTMTTRRSPSWRLTLLTLTAYLALTSCAYTQSYEIDEAALKELTWTLSQSSRISDLYDLSQEELTLTRQEVAICDSLLATSKKQIKALEGKVHIRDNMLKSYKDTLRERKKKERWAKVYMWLERAGWATAIVVTALFVGG